MKRHWRPAVSFVLAVVVLLTIVTPALGKPANDNAAQWGIYVASRCLFNTSDEFAEFRLNTRDPDPKRLSGRVVDWEHGNQFFWQCYLGDVKMSEGWGRVKAEAAVTVLGYIEGTWLEDLDGVFTFDFSGTTPMRWDGEDYVFNLSWNPEGEWTIKVPSLPRDNELGCFGYRLRSGESGYWAVINKWLTR